MIRRGKQDGWLKISPEAFKTWASLNDIKFTRVVPGISEIGGGALLASESLTADEEESRVLLTVPQDLILSLERVQQHSKVDKDFREVLESLGDFGRTARGAILSFLLVQSAISCPEISSRVGVPSPFSDYIKSLPMEPLPTFWTPSELQLLIGTTLAPAVSAKLKSLRREYDLLCSSAEHTRWYGLVQGHLDFDDWLQVDAMYRSRALDFPRIGHCMVPCVDLANHAAGERTVAIYEKDTDGNAILLLRDGKQLKHSEEVTITYGDEKGACEMLFSYGFLEDHMASAETVFLSLGISGDDKLRTGKATLADCPPGFKILDAGNGRIEWSGDFVWLLCVTEEDGLSFELARTVNGEGEMTALFQGSEIVGGAAELHNRLKRSDHWNIYRLRAVAILQQRVFDQLQILHTTQGDVEQLPHDDETTDISGVTFRLAMKLRELEFELLEKAYECFEGQKLELVERPEVVRYLAKMNETALTEPNLPGEDFS